jgi:hypothetical protein
MVCKKALIILAFPILCSANEYQEAGNAISESIQKMYAPQIDKLKARTWGRFCRFIGVSEEVAQTIGGTLNAILTQELKTSVGVGPIQIHMTYFHQEKAISAVYSRPW